VQCFVTQFLIGTPLVAQNYQERAIHVELCHTLNQN